ncbi:MlaD family protein [Amycolatopsis acidiphila]|nr:MlaD family protein [Amycolatopsis acidiphila]UIJ57715.1 MlaD family protein [Amycolatopsis acidiphila]GHG87249.1 hypothetical protein GCM10017788_60740 [Amycolatopsis acidiphila]
MIGVVVVVAALTAGVLMWNENKDNGKTRVTAVFANASPLVAGNRVQSYGVTVGTIDAIHLEGGQAHVEILLDPDAPPLHQDVRATIKPVSLLGERYVDLDAGSAGAPLMTGTKVIPAASTSSSVDLDQVLNALDDPTSAALAALVTAAGEGVSGHGADVSAALKALGPAMTRTGELGDILNQQNDLLTQLVASASGVTKELADDNGNTLDQLVGSAEQTLSTVAGSRTAVEGMLQELPQTLDKGSRTLSTLAGVTDSTIPTLRDLRPVTGDLSRITQELHDFTDAATPALASLPQVLDKLNGMLDQARPVVDQLVPASGDLRSVAGSVRPIGNTMLTHAPGTPSELENLMTGLANWSMATSGYDGIAHYYRGVVVLSPEVVKTLVGGLVPVTPPPNPAAQPGDPNAKPGQSPAPAPEPSLLPQLLGQQPAAGSGSTSAPLPGLAGRDPADPSNATGLSRQQESSLLDTLLGGVL